MTAGATVVTAQESGDFLKIRMPAGYLQEEDLYVFLRRLAACPGVSDLYLQTGSPPCAMIGGRIVRLREQSMETEVLFGLLDQIHSPSTSTAIRSGQSVDFLLHYCKTALARVNVSGISAPDGAGNGVQIVLRMIPGKAPSLDELEVESEIIQALKAFEAGLFLVTGPTHSGKSTLLAALLQHQLDRRSDEVLITYEGPIKDLLRSSAGLVSQSEVLTHFRTFAEGVRSALWRRPSTIYIGEAQDIETIRTMLSMAQAGHRVFARIHSDRVKSTFLQVSESFSRHEQEGIYTQLVSLTHMVITQILTLSPAGEAETGHQVAKRSWLAWNDEIAKGQLSAYRDGGCAGLIAQIEQDQERFGRLRE